MGDKLGEIKEGLFPERVEIFAGFTVSSSVISGFIVVALVLIVAAIVRFAVVPRFKNKPFGFQMLIEWVVESFSGMSRDLTGKLSAFLGPYTFGAAAYIFFGVLIEMFGFRPAIADISACLALALATFVIINVLAVREKGVKGRIKYYFEPVKFAAPIRLLTDCAVPVSMTFRLFGSILSGMVMMDLVYAVMPYVLPALLSPLFTLFHAVIQSYVFAALSLTFVAEATE